MKSILAFSVLVTTLTLLFGCSKNTEQEGPHASIRLSSDSVHVSKSRQVSVEVSVDPYEHLGRVEVLRKTAQEVSTPYETVPASAFSAGKYRFEYTLDPTDATRFYFVFIAYNRAGEIMTSKSLYVEPRPMIYTNGLKMLSKLTGKLLTPDHRPGMTTPNNTLTVDVGGTDLGIMWKLADGRIGYWFGDTVGSDWAVTQTGGPGVGSNWRSNVLCFSTDGNPDDGLTFSNWVTDNNGKAKELIYSAHNTSGYDDFTSIPTAAIHANGKDYVHYMNVRTWSSPKGWDTNYSSVYESADGGQTWTKQIDKIRFSGESHFAQVTYAKNGDGYIYMIGTQSGRYDAAYLARFAEADILEQAKYEYWGGPKGWLTARETEAVPIFESPVSEISLMYHRKYQRWLVTYLNVNNGIVLRHAETLSGPWSDDYNIVPGGDYGGMYSPYMYPLSDDSDTLYFTMSMWGTYNVYLMRIDMRFRE